jgi:SRSO17 transposase
LASVLGHADRVKPFEDYCVGLISTEGRKSVEPLAAVTAPERTAAQHQSLLHLVAQAPWSDAAVLRRVRERVLASVCREEPIQAWIIDDTGYPKLALGLDPRERTPLGRRGAAILRSGGQAGELPGLPRRRPGLR